MNVGALGLCAYPVAALDVKLHLTRRTLGNDGAVASFEIDNAGYRQERLLRGSSEQAKEHAHAFRRHGGASRHLGVSQLLHRQGRFALKSLRSYK